MAKITDKQLNTVIDLQKETLLHHAKHPLHCDGIFFLCQMIRSRAFDRYYTKENRDSMILVLNKSLQQLKESEV